MVSAALALVPACQNADSPALATVGCPACGEVAPRGAIHGGDIVECSGAVAGAVHPEVLYVHNDRGDTARFFAIGVDGVARGEFELTGAVAVDWEDVGRGPCGPAGGSCLYFGDIGDNDRSRASYAIYRVEEPAEIGAGQHAATAEVIPFVYPDGSRDAEALFVHPVTGAISLVTKEDGSSRIYELPLPITSGKTVTLIAAGRVEPPVGSPWITAGDVHPDGRGVLLRTKSDVFFYPMTPDQSVAQALAAAPCLLPSAGEDQGEAIAWLPGGWDYVTLSEGLGAPIHGAACSAP